MKSFLRTLGVAVCMFVLTPQSVDATGDEEECPRWICPCAGQTKLRMMFIMKRQNPQPVILQSARQTRERTRQLLDRIVSERFRNNHEHVESLESCVQNRDQRCLGLHLDRQCRLDHVPQMQQIQNVRNDEASLRAFMRDAQQLLSNLAVYVQQAKDDELGRVTDPIRSLADDIKKIEDSGIYQILCSLKIAANYRNIPWDATVARGVRLLSCMTFDTQAPIDNRNYMVFYTLEKLLNQIGRQVVRKRYAWEAPELPQSPAYLQIGEEREEEEEEEGNGNDTKDDVAQMYLQMAKANYDGK